MITAHCTILLQISERQIGKKDEIKSGNNFAETEQEYYMYCILTITSSQQHIRELLYISNEGYYAQIKA